MMLCGLAICGGLLAFLADPDDLGQSGREVGGALLSGAVIGGALLWFEERLEARRDAKDLTLAAQQERRDEQTALLQQLSAQTDLSDIQMPWYDLHNAFLNKKNLRGAFLRGADLRNSSITSSDLSSAFLDDAILTNTRLIGSDLTGTILTGANLRGAKLISTDLTRADLTGADLTGCSLRHADLSEAKLEGATFAGATLDAANLSTAELAGAKLEGVTYSDETTWPPDFEPPPSAPKRADVDYRPV